MYKVSENRKCTEWPQTELKHLTVKSTLYTLNTTEAQTLVRFDLPLAVSEIEGRQKSEMHQVTQTELEHLTVQSNLHTLKTYP